MIGDTARERQWTGARLVARSLRDAGVTRVFSLSGNQILGVFDALPDEGIEIVHTRHEGAAVHMADAWARLTGTAGVCLVTAGSGHANALGALSMAEAGESPVVLLSGHAPLDRAGWGAFQEMDQVGLARPITRWSAVAERAAGLPWLLAQAFRIAQSGRQGPVHLSLPVDVLTAAVAGDPDLPAPAAYLPEATAPDASAVTAVIDALRRAERPMIVAGQSAARSALHQVLAALSARTGIPLLIVDHPRGLTDPAIGRAAQALGQADAVLLFGKRQDYRIGYAGAPPVPGAGHLLQIDPWPDEIGRHRPVDAGVVADLLPAARALLAASEELEWPPRTWAQTANALFGASVLPPRLEEQASEDAPLHPVAVFDALAHLAATRGWERTCFVLDGGEFGQWARARLRLRPPHHLINEPSGTIGFAVPFAVAARAARPDATVIAIAGDGAFGFYTMELETAVRCRLPFLAVVGNDASWSTERFLQMARYGDDRAIATDLSPARYDQVAIGLGAHGEYVERLDALEPALRRALAAVDAGQPAVVNVRIRSVASPAGEPPG